MSLIIQKYGGSSLATPEKIKSIASRIVERYQSGVQLIIIVSAMGKTTNDLYQKARSITENPDKRELDMLISVGERVSISMMSMAINAIEPELAVAYTGSQIGLITDCNHSDARILEIKGDRLRSALAAGKIPVIAGFQGVSTQKEITTLGRGGSDTTAVAVTAALGGDLCEIYSDVDGVYTIDPRLTKRSRRINELDHDTMLEISSLGAKVLKDEAVEYAKRLNIKIAAGSSKTGYQGTIVSRDSLNKNTVEALVYYDKLYYFDSGSDNFLFLNPDIRFYQKCGCNSICIYDEKYYNESFSRKYDKKKCYSLSIVGTGIRSKEKELGRIFQLLEESGNNIIGLNNSNIRYEIFMDKKIEKELLELIHELFF